MLHAINELAINYYGFCRFELGWRFVRLLNSQGEPELYIDLETGEVYDRYPSQGGKIQCHL